MRISEDYILREIAGDYIIVPTGRESLKFQGLITVNETGAFLWNCLQESSVAVEALTESLCQFFEIDEYTAKKDVEDFLDKIDQRGMLIHE